MKLQAFDPSLLNFLSGVLASVGIVYATTAAINSGTQIPRYSLYLLAIPWVVASFSLAMAAPKLMNARRQVEIRTHSPVQRSADEIYEIEQEEFAKIRKTVWVHILISFVSVLIGIVGQILLASP